VGVQELPAEADVDASRRSWRRLAAGLVLIEAGAALVGAGIYLAELLTATATVPRNVLMLLVLLGLIGLGLLLVARGLLGGRRWARSPAVTWQALLLAVAWYVAAAGHLLAGLAVAGLAVVTAVAAVRGTPVGD
jgi:hypothetical protein